MNELARMIDELEDCPVCGKPCIADDVDNDGNPIHKKCRIDREAARIDAAHDVWIGNYPERTVLLQRGCQGVCNDTSR